QDPEQVIAKLGSGLAIGRDAPGIVPGGARDYARSKDRQPAEDAGRRQLETTQRDTPPLDRHPQAISPSLRTCWNLGTVPRRFEDLGSLFGEKAHEKILGACARQLSGAIRATAVSTVTAPSRRPSREITGSATSPLSVTRRAASL